MLEKLFKLKQNHTSVKTEVVAGITTFMTMAYILAVNPSILADAGIDPPQYCWQRRWHRLLPLPVWRLWPICPLYCLPVWA